VTSTLRTLLYQNHATAKRLAMVTATTVPCAPIGTAHTNNTTKRDSRMTNRALKPVSMCRDEKTMRTQYRGDPHDARSSSEVSRTPRKRS
jgi:hypothetical protein